MNAKCVPNSLRDANDVIIRSSITDVELALTFLVLITDAEIALTFLDTATICTRENTPSLRIHEARRAYDSVLHLLPRFTLAVPQAEALDERMNLLRRRLIADSGLEN